MLALGSAAPNPPSDSEGSGGVDQAGADSGSSLRNLWEDEYDNGTGDGGRLGLCGLDLTCFA